MRIVIDMQGAQTESRFRDIGRYTMSFAQAVVRSRGEHEVILALSGLFPATIEPIRKTFDGLLSQENIRVWHAPGPVRAECPKNNWRRQAAEIMREAFLASLAPDVIHIPSLFEGFIDDAVASIGRFGSAIPISVSLHDLIPLVNSSQYLKPNPDYERFYLNKVDDLKRADLLLSISEFSRWEVMEVLSFPSSSIINTSLSVEEHFKPLIIDEMEAKQIYEDFGLERAFVLYNGGADERKNLPRLIRAFAALPVDLRKKHQLLLVGKISEKESSALMQLSEKLGLSAGEIRFSGYVSDLDLVRLYNLCRLFVFPSWHEGFGLPVLEAMACGAPTICSDAASLPEVMGMESALFDPLDVDAIAKKMHLALESDEFRAELRAHGIRQADKFSWEITARRAITAWENMLQKMEPKEEDQFRTKKKPCLAFVSPLPPERSGVADYSATLIPALSQYYEITVVVEQDRISDPWIVTHCEIRDAAWLQVNFLKVDHVVYQVGNSPFHKYMLPLIQRIPGIVVLHDFYLSGLMAWLEMAGGGEKAWVEALYYSHGFTAVKERFRDVGGAKQKYPVNFQVLSQAESLIVHSEHARNLISEWYGDDLYSKCEVVPLARSPAALTEDKALARKALGIGKDDFVVCSFGFLVPTKLNHRLLQAWLSSSLAGDERCRLIFVGENHGGNYGLELEQLIRSSGFSNKISITGFVSGELYQNYLHIADLAVQLRTHSRGETSAAVLDCMNYALPTIINNNGSMSEFDKAAVWQLPDNFCDMDLVEALEELWKNPERRNTLGKCAHHIILQRHTPISCAKEYVKVIEKQIRPGTSITTDEIVRAVSRTELTPDKTDLLKLARSLSKSFPEARSKKRLFLDISATCRHDLKTGIERSARALMLALLEDPPLHYRVEPVYLCNIAGEWHYRYARRYLLSLLECPVWALEDVAVEVENGDILLGLDLSAGQVAQAEQAGLYADYRSRGVAVYSVVYDLLPVTMPEVFPPSADLAHEKWLRAVSTFDGALCISKAVAERLTSWQLEHGIDFSRRREYKIGWFHLGADVERSAPTRGLPEGSEEFLGTLSQSPTFLMVGTVEPRKGHLQVLDAFSVLWQKGVKAHLVVVGKEGWKGLPDELRRNIPETVRSLREHSENGHRLFWLEDVSDEYLEKIYAASACLIAASYDEGFGLPLVEAAQHGLCIIARNIPVFKEVVGAGVTYFDTRDGTELATTIAAWLDESKRGNDIRPEKVNFMSWKESAKALMNFVTGKRYSSSEEIRKRAMEQHLN